jgi:hypothetical protein
VGLGPKNFPKKAQNPAGSTARKAKTPLPRRYGECGEHPRSLPRRNEGAKNTPTRKEKTIHHGDTESTENTERLYREEQQNNISPRRHGERGEQQNPFHHRDTENTQDPYREEAKTLDKDEQDPEPQAPNGATPL